MFLDQKKRGRGHPHKILVPWDVGVYEVGQGGAVASLFSYFKDPGHDPGLGGCLLLLGVALVEAVMVVVG